MPISMQLNRIEEKLEHVDKRLNAIEVHLAEYNAVNAEHVRRTTQIETQLMPIAKTYERWIGASVLLGLLAALGGAIGAFAWLWS